MKNQIIISKDGNTYVGSIACKLACKQSVLMDGVEYSVKINRCEPAIELRAGLNGFYSNTPLFWGSKEFLRCLEIGEIQFAPDSIPDLRNTCH